MPVPRIVVLFFAALPLLAQPAHIAADLGRSILAAGLDPAQCYRVRDLELDEEDARFFLTDGYIMFGKPVDGAPLTAVFSADTDGGDALVLLLPPGRSERKSMAAYTGAPNLNEHFAQAAFIFTESSARGLLDRVRASGARNFPDIGAIMQERWGRVLANLVSGFETRLALDLLTPGEKGGFFEAVVDGKKLGNFDVFYDSRSAEQLVAGQVTTRRDSIFWDTWTSFVSRSHRGEPEPAPEEEILSYKIDAALDPSLNMHCVTRIHVRTTEQSRNLLAFDLSGKMRVTSAKVDGRPAESYERDSVRNGLLQNNGNELLLVLPDKPLEPGTVHDIEITHDGKVVIEAGHDVYFVSARGTGRSGREACSFATPRRDPLTGYPRRSRSRWRSWWQGDAGSRSGVRSFSTSTLRAAFRRTACACSATTWGASNARRRSATASPWRSWRIRRWRTHCAPASRKWILQAWMCAPAVAGRRREFRSHLSLLPSRRSLQANSAALPTR